MIGRTTVDVRAGQFRITERRATVSAVPDNFQSNSLSHGTHRARIDDEREIGVAVNVDEPRCHNASARIESLSDRVFGDVPHIDNSAVENCNIGDERFAPRAVENRAALNQEINVHSSNKLKQGPD